MLTDSGTSRISSKAVGSGCPSLVSPEAKEQNFKQLGAIYRQDFPLLCDSEVVYLDSAASAQKPQLVIDAEAEFYRSGYANIHRGVYPLSVHATERYEQSRTEIAEFIGASDPHEVVFTRGATEALNLVASSWGRANISQGDEILLTLLEHHSNIVPWQLLAQAVGARVVFAGVAPDGSLDMEDFKAKLSAKTKLVGVTMLANALGTAPDVTHIIKLAHQAGAVVVVDAAQSVAHQQIEVSSLGADFLAFSGHKLYGPTGIGVLWGKAELLQAMPPYQGGGDMIRFVTTKGSSYAEPPAKFEAGTPHIAGAIGLAEAIRYLKSVGMKNIEHYETGLLRYMEDCLSSIPRLKTLGPAREKQGLISFLFEGIHPHDLAQFLSDKYHIAVRAGHHCAQPLMEHFGLAATTRASLGLYNSYQDADRLCTALEHAAAAFHLDSL